MANFYDKASLVLIPSGTKEGTIFSQKPTNGDGDFTFSRSTSATRVGSSGYIEKETQNLLLQSNQFDTSWNLNGSSVTSGQSGYDGTNDAWKLEAVSATTAYVRQLIDISSSVATFSFYAKAGTTNWTYVNCVSVTAFFDLSNGTKGYVSSGAIDASIVSVGSGWYRISLTGSGMTQQRIYTAPSNNNSVSAIGDNIYIQDAQLEQGLVARDYIETTTSAVYGGITDNIPRLDYTDSSCPSLLLEPQRTNVIESSEYFDGSLWSATNITITNNDADSPEGINNASKIVLNSGSSSSCELRKQNNASVIFGNDYTFSIFAKADEFDKIELDFTNFVMGDTYVVADLTNGTITFRGVDNTSDSIEDYGDGWYRITLTGTAVATGTTALIFRLGANPAGDGSSGFHIYGAQFEQGSYATSYIPTYGSAAVTRNQEVLSADTSSFGISNEFTLFIDTNGMQVEGTSLNSMDDLRWYSQASDYYRFYKSSDALFISNNIQVNDRTKIALKVNSTECKTFVDGVLISTISLTTPFSSFDSISKNSEAKFKDSFNKIILFPTALTDEEAIALTTI